MRFIERFEDEAPALIVAGMVALVACPFIFVALAIFFRSLLPKWGGWVGIFPGLPLTFVLTGAVFTAVFSAVREK
jgi:hypothetical protein